MTPEERTVLERARVATLATADGEGRPHAVPICYAVLDPETAGVDPADDLDPETRLVSAVDEKPKSTRELRRVRDVRANPRVAVLVDHYSEDWSRLAWVQIRGRARIVATSDTGSKDAAGTDSPTNGGDAESDDAVREAAVAALESKYDQYAEHALRERPLVEIRVDRTLSWGALEEYPE